MYPTCYVKHWVSLFLGSINMQQADKFFSSEVIENYFLNNLTNKNSSNDFVRSDLYVLRFSHLISELCSEPVSERTQLQLFLLGKKSKKIVMYELKRITYTVWLILYNIYSLTIKNKFWINLSGFKILTDLEFGLTDDGARDLFEYCEGL